MKKMLSLLLAIIMVLSLVACGGSGEAANEAAKTETSTTAGSTSSEKAEESSAATRTDVKIPLQSVGSSMDPHVMTLTVDKHVAAQVYEGLYRVLDDGSIEPRLAKNYEVSEDGLEYTYYLRDDVTFHNGDPFTAADVVWSFQRCIDNVYLTTYFAFLEKVEAVDDYTVKFTMSAPNSVFPITMNEIKIINKNVFEEVGDAYGASASLAGTGPYYMESYESATKIVLKAYEDYYLGKASIETVEFIPMLDTSTQLMAFESGQFDFCGINAADWEMVKSSGKYNTSQDTGTHVSYVMPNVGKEGSPLCDQRVRQAVAYCMNKEDMVAIAVDGYGDVANHMTNPATISGATETGKHYSRDLEKAKALLAEAGYADGFHVVIEVVSGANNRYAKIAEVLQENLAEIGITSDIELGEAATLIGGWRSDPVYDIGVSGHAFEVSYNEIFAWIGEGVSNNRFDRNENIDLDYITETQSKALAATSLEEQAQYFAEIEDYVTDIAAYLPVLYIQNLYAWDSNLSAVPPVSRYYVYDWHWN